MGRSTAASCQHEISAPVHEWSRPVDIFAILLSFVSSAEMSVVVIPALLIVMPMDSQDDAHGYTAS